MSRPASFVHDDTPPRALPSGARIAGLLFDLDGTLYLQGPVRRAMLVRLLGAGVVRPFSTWRDFRIVNSYRRAQEHLRRRAEPLAAEPVADDQMRLACEWSGASPEQAAKAIAHWMEDSPLDILRRSLRPGVVEFLDAARAKGIRLGLLSDYPAARKLEALGLEGYFSVALSARDRCVGTFKPSPKGLIMLLKELALEPETAVYIGDRPSVDGEAAHRAGIASVILGQPRGRTGRGWVGAPDIPALRILLSV